MKKIIVFQGGIETLEFFSLELAKTFRTLGHEVFVFDLNQENDSYHLLAWFHEPGNTVMITFNFNGLRGEEIFYEGTQIFWDTMEIPCINIIVDHPFYYHELIKKAPKRYYQICIDRLHEAYMKRFFPDIRLLPFVPSGGTDLPIGPLPLQERSIDLVFTGHYTPPSQFDQHITRIDEEYTAFYRSIIDDLITHPDTPMEAAFEKHLKQAMGPLSETDLAKCMENMIFIDLYVRFYFRGLVVKTLLDHGIKVGVFGKGWSLLECEHPENLIDFGGGNSASCLELISKARISLNVMPWFKDGAHDRIFNSMLNGAVCLTDKSRYLEEEFTDGKDIVFYSLSEIEKLPSIVKGLLEDPSKMESISEAGYQKAKSNHTWAERAKVLVTYSNFS